MAENTQNNDQPSTTASPIHAFFAFSVLEARLKGKPTPKFPIETSDEFPLFVTWNVKSRSDNWRLRGCIGNFSPMPLAKGLADYAIIAGLEDHRFSPISLSELPKLQCTVSLLVEFEDCADPYDWQVGKHGIRIKFSPSSNQLGGKHARILSSCFLPEVAESAGWDKRETLEAAVQKAGYTGTIDDSVLDKLEVRRYQSSVVTVTFDEWQKWKLQN